MTPLDPGGQVMDFLRSAYRVNMILDASQNLYLIDWFRAAPGAALFPGVHPVSLNWSKPELGALGSVGEVRTFGTPYSKGGKPLYCPIDVSWPITGQLDWFRTGAPGPAVAPPAITWEGRRTGPLNPPGLFPPPQQGLFPFPSLTTNKGYTWSPGVAGSTSWPWTSVGHTPPLAAAWQKGNVGNYFPCYPSLYTMEVNTTTAQVFLKCVTLSADNKTSTWVDPSASILAADEILTLVSN